MSLAFRIKPLTTTAPFSLPIKFKSAILLLPPRPYLSGFCDFYWLAEEKKISYILNFGIDNLLFKGNKRKQKCFHRTTIGTEQKACTICSVQPHFLTLTPVTF